MNKKTKSIIIYVVILAFLILLTMFLFGSQTKQSIRYDQLIGYFESGDMQTFTLDLGTGEMVYKLRSQEGKTLSYVVPSVNLFYEDVKDYLKEATVSENGDKLQFDYIRPAETPWWVAMLPTLLLIGVMAVSYTHLHRTERFHHHLRHPHPRQ